MQQIKKWDSSFYDNLSFEEHIKLEFHDDYRQKKRQFLEQFLSSGGKLLDVGCGSGFDLRYLAQSNKKSNLRMVVGLDISMNMLLQARKLLSENGIEIENILSPKKGEKLELINPVHLVKADAYCLPFRDETYDLVHSHELSVFNYGSVDERVVALSEQRRVCKTGGTIVTVLPQRDQEGFLPTGEPQMRYFFRSAGIRFVKAVYHLGELPQFSVPKILALLQRFIPRFIAGRLLKTPEEYLCQKAHMIIGVGKKYDKS